MRPFSIILLLYVGYIVTHNNKTKDIFVHLLGFTIFVEIFINIGYFIKIGSYELMYSEVLVAILGIFSILILLRYPIGIKPLYAGGILVFTSLTSTFLLLINPFDYNVIENRELWVYSFLEIGNRPEFTTQTLGFQIRIILYVIIAIAANRMVDRGNIDNLVKVVQKYGKMVILIGVIEFITKNIFRSNILHDILLVVFGQGSSTLNSLLLRNNLFTIQALNREPNHFTSALFWLGITYIYNNDDRKNKYHLLAIIILMLISGSLASVIFFAALAALYTIRTKKKLSIILLFFFGITILIQMVDLSYYFNRILAIQHLFEMNGSANLSSSEHIRIGGIIENLRILLYRPLFGIGLGTLYTHAALPTIISNLGLLGTITWFYFNFSGIANIRIAAHHISAMVVFIVVFTFNLNSGLLYSMGFLSSLLCIKYADSKRTMVSLAP